MKAPLLSLVVAAAILLPLPALADGHPGKTDVFAGETGFSHAIRDGARYDARLGGFRLQDEGNGYRPSGRFTLDDLHYGSIDRVVASWNADCPPGTAVLVETQASGDEGKTWSSWYELARWGDAEVVNAVPKAARLKADPMGKVDEDTLMLAKQANRLRCRVTLSSIHPTVTPVVSLVALTVIDHTQSIPPDDRPGPAWGHAVSADFRSQGWETSDMSYRVCGPTSTGMMLTSHGIKLPTAQVCAACWDELNGIYGNWPFIAAGASALMRAHADQLSEQPGHAKAFRAFVSWAPDWKDVEREVLAGNPCVVSIHYGAHELTGSPTVESEGHLILVRGFTAAGDVIVNDPAARTPERGGVVYNRKQLHAARHGGPVIMFRPYD